MAGALATGTRCAAFVGSYLSGKTTLVESLLYATGAIPRKGSVKDGNTVGDSVAEARERQMSTELSVAHTEFLGDDWAFIDCPGSVELAQESYNALLACDVAVVVCEPAAEKAVSLTPIFRYLQAHAIPHLVFINKMDQATQPRCRASPTGRWCCARFRSRRGTARRAMSIWSASGPISTSPARPPI